MQSWIIIDRETGRAVFETWNRTTAEAINADKYAALPAKEYLASLNAPAKLLTVAEAYDMARDAQTVFEDALKAEYGPRAIVMRYAHDSRYPQSLRDKSEAFKLACDELSAAWRRARGEM